MPDLTLSDFSPELALTVASARWPLDEAGRQEIRRHASAVLDWERFLAWVARHRIAPLVHRNLRLAGSLPDHVLERLQDQDARNTRQVLVQLSEAARIKGALDAAGIRSMMIKGPLLSVLAFGDATLRASRDVDLYVDWESVRVADQLIVEAGYRRFAPDFTLTPREEAAFLRLRCQYAYFSEQAGVVQELHWRLTSNATLMPIDDATLWSRSDPIRLNGVDFTTLPEEEMFLYLCIHGSVHVWFRLKWLVDIAALLPRMSADALERVAVRARALGIVRPLYQALLLAHALLAAPVPKRLLSAARQCGAARRMAAAAVRALNWAGSPAEPANTRWFNTWIALQAYRLKPTLAYRWAEFQDQMCSPEDWARVPLPEGLFFLYLPLRPVSWAVRKLKRAVAT
jgi:Uncharacterised nucleotidyltransferase